MISVVLSSFVLLNLFLGGSCYPSELPHRTLVGVSVVDTQIVRDAFAYAQGYEDSSVFNHSIRSWIFGSIIVNRNPAYTNKIDEEVHALGTILHDIGFGQKVTPGQNIDASHAAAGGNGVRKFLANNTVGKTWKETRVQVLVDAVTLHLEDSGPTKALEIRAVRDGQQIDLMGPSGYVTTAEYNSVIAAYPLGEMKGPGVENHSHPKSTSADHTMPSNSGQQMMSQGHGHPM
jgi:hypothetical protein